MTSNSTSARAVLSLIFGVLGLLCILPCVGPIAAIGLAIGEKDGMARAGMILGWITLVLYAAAVLVALMLAAVGGFWALQD